MSNKCGMKCEIYSRVVGYFRSVNGWNKGKKEEFKQRVEFDEKTSLQSKRGLDNKIIMENEGVKIK
jgi:ribonucleoside-triphosphate reductase